MEIFVKAIINYCICIIRHVCPKHTPRIFPKIKNPHTSLQKTQPWKQKQTYCVVHVLVVLFIRTTNPLVSVSNLPASTTSSLSFLVIIHNLSLGYFQSLNTFTIHFMPSCLPITIFFCKYYISTQICYCNLASGPVWLPRWCRTFHMQR